MKRQRVVVAEDDVYSGEDSSKRPVMAPPPLTRDSATAKEPRMMSAVDLGRLVAQLNHEAYQLFLQQMDERLVFTTLDEAVTALHAYAARADCRVRIRTSRLNKGRVTKVVGCCVKGCPFTVTIRNTSVSVTTIDTGAVSRFRHMHPTTTLVSVVSPTTTTAGGHVEESRLVCRVEWRHFFQWVAAAVPQQQLVCADVLRQLWVIDHPMTPLNGMMGNFFSDDVHTMGSATNDEKPLYEWTWYRKAISRAIKVQRKAKPITSYSGTPTNYGKGVGNLFFETVVIPEKADFEQAIGPHETPYFQWWYERTNRVHDEDNLLALLCVRGLDAIDLQKTLLLLQRNHDVFDNGQTEARGDGYPRHAVFPSPAGAGKASPRCYLAINKYALRAVRLSMLRYIPVECKFPSAPLLLQGWATKPVSVYEDNVQRQGMAAVIGFIAQHVHRGNCGATAGGGSEGRCGCIHQHTAPQFSLYEGLPLFVSYLRCQKDATLLERIKDSQPGERLADAGDSLYKLLAAFVFQKKDHFILRSALEQVWGRFENGDNPHSLKDKYAVAYAVTRYLKESPGMGTVGQKWIPIYIPSWGALKLPAHVKCPSSCAAGGYLPHHFLYELCFDTQNFSLEFRAMLATQMIIHHPPTAAVNYSPEKLADFWFGVELRDYEASLAKPVRQLPLRVSQPESKQLYLLNGLYLLLSSMQHLAWNPGCFDDSEIRGPARIADPALFACKQLDLPVAYERCKTKGGDCKVYYMEQFLLAWTGAMAPNLSKLSREALYAYNLVRDEQFYADRTPLDDDDDEEAER